MLSLQDIYNRFLKVKDELHIEISPLHNEGRFGIKNNNINIQLAKLHSFNNTFLKASFVIKKKDVFSGVFNTQGQFVWNFEDENDVVLFMEKIKKELASPIGPFEFSRRSTYIKKEGPDSRAYSGNFVSSAKVENVVVIDKDGNISSSTEGHDKEAWFLIHITGSYGNNMDILYNLENWLPVDHTSGYGWNTHVKRRATTNLTDTGGKLLTMHDKFVIDLAVKIYSGG